MTSPGDHYLEDALLQLRKQKQLAERAMAHLTDADLHFRPDPESNSIAVIVRHMAGNMRSRWTDFLTSDGEKPDRMRESEFDAAEDTERATIMRWWESGWAAAFAAIEPLTAADLQRTVTIRGEPHTVLEAINRQMVHYAQHVGQIVYIAKHLRGGQWQSLSIPRGASDRIDVAKSGEPRAVQPPAESHPGRP